MMKIMFWVLDYAPGVVSNLKRVVQNSKRENTEGGANYSAKI